MNSAAPFEHWRVAVLAGGESAEREVSLRSGAAVAQALAEAGHASVAIDPAGRALADIDWSRIDACFIALHGGAGEDGRVQAELERLGIPYTGCGPEACRLAMSKSASKQRFAECGVPTPAWTAIDANRPGRDLQKRVARIGYPLVVKPDTQGSSLGVSLVDGPEKLGEAIDAAAAFDALVIAERQIAGREFTVAVLGERALPILEVVTPEPVFSYEAKYASSLTEYRFDFELATRTRVELLHAAVGAALALETRGLVRVDVMVGHDARVGVLEVNAIPGMTLRSLAPLAAQRAGIPMPVLCDQLVRECLATAEVR
jgi:D-alanine-D-alanine ligase